MVLADAEGHAEAEDRAASGESADLGACVNCPSGVGPLVASVGYRRLIGSEALVVFRRPVGSGVPFDHRRMLMAGKLPGQEETILSVLVVSGIVASRVLLFGLLAD